jgi:hypothetical protein
MQGCRRSWSRASLPSNCKGCLTRLLLASRCSSTNCRDQHLPLGRGRVVRMQAGKLVSETYGCAKPSPLHSNRQEASRPRVGNQCRTTSVVTGFSDGRGLVCSVMLASPPVCPCISTARRRDVMASERRQEEVKGAFPWTPRERFSSASTVEGDLAKRRLAPRFPGFC